MKIYIGYHKPAYLVKDDVFTPLKLGAAFDDGAIIGDGTGNSIASKNKEFCEMTGIYWAWKNDLDAEWIGFMHYRRYLDFSTRERDVDLYGCINASHLNEASLAEFGINEKTVEELIGKNKSLKVILPCRWPVQNIGCKSIYEQYATADFHNEKDLAIVRSVINDLTPDYLPHYDNVMADVDGYFTNIFVFRRDVFEEYCGWIFLILFEIDRRIDLTNYSTASRRAIGYIAERLMNVFVKKMNFEKDEMIELNRVFFRDTESANILKLNNQSVPQRDNSITLVSASDDNFVPHLAALIESIKDGFPSKVDFDYYILDGGISSRNKKLLQLQFCKDLKQTANLHFINCVDLYRDVPVHMHFAIPTFYRLDLAKFFGSHNRVIYLDADMIVLSDLSELWRMDLDGNDLAAVPDVMMKSFVTSKVLTNKETGSLQAKIYLEKHLKMGDSYDQYFQAGLLVIDMEKYAKSNVSDKSRKELNERVYWLVDQDILNKYFLGKVKFLDSSWNCLNLILNCKNTIDSMWASKIKEDFENPKIIHYAGFEAKPWNNRNAPWADVYWYYLRKTFWYEKIRLCLETNTTESFNYSAMKNIILLARKAWLVLPLEVRRVAAPLKNAFIKRVITFL